MKKTKIITIVIAVAVLAVLAVTLFSKGGITGNVIDGTLVDTSGFTKCSDTDGGVNSNESGFVNVKYWWGSSNYEDKCYGANRYVIEYYCYADGILAQQVVKCENGCFEGACVTEKECEPNSDGDGVIDTYGKEWKNTCAGVNWVTFTCDADGAVERTISACTTRCDATTGGCAGLCSGDTDEANNPNVPGQISIDGVVQLDKCYGNTIQQYACNGDRVRNIVLQACGANMVCRDDGAGAYCDAVATSGDVSGAIASTSTLQAVVDVLSEDVGKLKADVCVLNSTATICPQAGSQTPIVDSTTP